MTFIGVFHGVFGDIGRIDLIHVFNAAKCFMALFKWYGNNNDNVEYPYRSFFSL